MIGSFTSSEKIQPSAFGASSASCALAKHGITNAKAVAAKEDATQEEVDAAKATLEAAVKAVETVDECVGRVVEAIEEVGGVLLITADHGNSEQMIDYKTGEPHTAHTTNPVPFILVNYDDAYTLREGGCLADIAPTLIEMMGMEQPKEMTGHNVIKN